MTWKLPTNQNIQTENFTLYFGDSETQAYFEHDRLGDNCGGGLWFDEDGLMDYDGVFSLPQEVTNKLRELGIPVDTIFDE